MGLTQAQRLVLGQLARLVAPALAVCVLLAAARRTQLVRAPVWADALIALIAIPLFHVGRAHWRVDVLQLVDEAYRRGFLSDYFYEKFGELGHTYNFYVLWDMDYCTEDAAVIKAVLATDFNNWVKGERFDSYMHSVLGTGVFNADGELWKFHRSMTRPFFARERITDFETFNRHAEEAILKMKERLREGFAVDFADLISRFTLDAATEFLFGACTTSPRRSARRRTQSRIARASRTDTPMRTVDRYLTPIIERALAMSRAAKQAPQGEKEEVADGETLLDHLARYTTDPTILHDEILNIMIAGRDTTGGTLTFVIYFLTQHPDVLQRLRQEILDVVGPSNLPTYDDIKQMKYLRAVLNETQRLYPPVPWNMRYAVEDSIVPNSEPEGKPWFIPAGASVSYSVHCMHRRKDYWGPDAEEFDPDRFLDERLHKYLTPNPFIFLPFNAGPRICLGQQFAYNEMSFFLVKLLQTFEDISFERDAFEPNALPPAEWAKFPGRKGKEKFWPRAHLTLYSEVRMTAGGMWVKMREAQAMGQVA
uniref:Cytochrome P450 monooxygenase pc-1 n=1 Tax=Phanerodontia chrysosporium TaxID=2822231 RepID=Q8NJK4_PHACH|nr:cytochrome P450 monooxygenase pc-1 [Phanerodontia chrysosporium]